MFVNDFELKKGDMSIIINGVSSPESGKCVLHNGRTLVPVGVFDETGCATSYDENTYVITISKNDTVLEIIPYIIGMRKNQNSGYYVPIKPCARYVDGELYVPVRAIAEELGLTVGWDGDTCSVTIDG